MKQDTEKILNEAEQIKNTGRVSAAPEPDSPGSPADGAASPGAGGSSPAPAGLHGAELAALAVHLTDWLYVGTFGPGAAIQEPLRSQAHTAWAAVIERYLPQVAEWGPIGQLATVYGLHTLSCLALAKEPAPTAPSSAPSAEPAQEKPAS